MIALIYTIVAVVMIVNAGRGPEKERRSRAILFTVLTVLFLLASTL